MFGSAHNAEKSSTFDLPDIIGLSKTLHFIDISIFTSCTKRRRFRNIPSVSVETLSVTLQIRIFPLCLSFFGRGFNREGNGVLLHKGEGSDVYR
jgi:hypothetical protein